MDYLAVRPLVERNQSSQLPNRMRGFFALLLVLLFVAQTAFFSMQIWRNWDRVRIEDIIYGSMCGQPIQR
jgi:hypothetical protein